MFLVLIQSLMHLRYYYNKMKRFCLHLQQPLEQPLSINPDCTELSTTQPSHRGSSALEPKIPLPTEPPPIQPSNTHPSPVAAAADKLLQDDDYDHPSTDPLEQQQKSSEDKYKRIKDSDFANCNHDQYSTLTQGTTTPSETTTIETPKPLSDLPGVPDHPIASEDNDNFEVNKAGRNQRDKERSAPDKSQMLQENDHYHPGPLTDRHGLHALQEKTSANGDQDSDIPNGNHEQSSTLTQGTTTAPELTTLESTSETLKQPSILSGAPDHPRASEGGGNSEANRGGQKQTAEERSADEDNNHDHCSADAHGLHEKQQKPSEDGDQDLDVANGNCEQSSTLTQGTTTLPETTTSTNETPKPPSDVPDVPEHPTHGEDGGSSEASKGDQSHAHESNEERLPAKLPKYDRDAKKEAIGNGEPEHTPPPQMQLKHVTTKQDSMVHPNDEEPNNQPSQQQIGEFNTSAAVTSTNQVSFDVLHGHCKTGLVNVMLDN